MCSPGLSQAGGGGVRAPLPEFLADQLTLFQPGGSTLSPPSTTCNPPIIRPCDGPVQTIYTPLGKKF